METGRDILEQALRLLHYTNSYGETDGQAQAALYKRGLPVVNQIYADLWYMDKGKEAPFCPLLSLEQDVGLSDAKRDDCLVFGVAMLLAQGEGDAENQAFFASIYNRKRGAASHGRRQDVLPGAGSRL